MIETKFVKIQRLFKKWVFSQEMSTVLCQCYDWKCI